MKKIISVLLTAVMMLTMMSVSAFADEVISDTCGESLNCFFDSDTGELAIFGSGNMTNYSSTSPAPWSEYKSQITKLTVSDGVTSIGNDTFTGCENLAEVVLPEGLTKIGDSAFRDCVKLTEIAIPDSVTSLGHYAFYGCTALAEVNGSGIRNIGNYAFKKCTSLKAVTIPETLTKIGKGAFEKCEALVYAEFKGTAEQWAGVTVGEINEALTSVLYRVGNTVVIGDVNGDGNINSADALLCLQHSTVNITLMSDAFTAADANADGKINSLDALKILQAAVNPAA